MHESRKSLFIAVSQGFSTGVFHIFHIFEPEGPEAAGSSFFQY